MSARLHAISMPKWGMTMTEGTVAGWLSGEGDTVAASDEVIEIETTKITNVMEAHAPGVLVRRVVSEGATVPVGTLLGVIADGEVSSDEIDQFIAAFAPPDIAGAEAESGSAARIVPCGDHRLNVLTMGEGPEAVFLLHGFGGDLNSWMFNQPALSERYSVHAVDLPGHGSSSPTIGSGSVPDLAGAVIALSDTLETGSVHLVGHSLGGAIALYLALKRPDRVASVTLVCPGGLGADINMDFIDGYVAADRRKPMKAVLGLLFARPGAVTRQMVEESLRYKRLDGVGAVLGAVADANFKEGRQAGGMREGLASVKPPIQVVWGREDAIIPAHHADGLPAAVAVHVLDDAGHMPHMEQPRIFNDLVVEFLSRSRDGG